MNAPISPHEKPNPGKLPKVQLSDDERVRRERLRRAKYEEKRRRRRKGLADDAELPPVRSYNERDAPAEQAGLDKEEIAGVRIPACSQRLLEGLQRLYPKHNEVVYAKPRSRRYYRSAPLAQFLA